MKCLVVTHLLTVGTEGEMPGAGHNSWAGRVRGGEQQDYGHPVRPSPSAETIWTKAVVQATGTIRAARWLGMNHILETVSPLP